MPPEGLGFLGSGLLGFRTLRAPASPAPWPPDSPVSGLSCSLASGLPSSPASGLSCSPASGLSGLWAPQLPCFRPPQLPGLWTLRSPSSPAPRPLDSPVSGLRTSQPLNFPAFRPPDSPASELPGLPTPGLRWSLRDGRYVRGYQRDNRYAIAFVGGVGGVGGVEVWRCGGVEGGVGNL